MKIISKDFCTFSGVDIAIYMGLCRKPYILLVRKFQTSEMLVKWSPTSKLSDIKLSHILDGRHIFLLVREPTCPPYLLNLFFLYFQIFFRVCYDRVLSIGYHVNFADLGITLGLFTFCTVSPTFFQTSISPDFTWIFIDWVSAGFFPGVFSPWPEKKDTGKKTHKKNIPPNSVKNIRPYSLSREDAIFATSIIPSENQMIRINSCLWQIFPWVILLRENISDFILDFLFFYDDIFLWNFE